MIARLMIGFIRRVISLYKGEGEHQKMAHAASKTAIRVYNLIWGFAVPLLRLNKRISEGFSQKTLQESLPSADIWIQAASGGEAYLADSIIRNLSIEPPIKILLTSSTRQGKEVLEKAVLERRGNSSMVFFVAYFPFDRPDIMKKAVASVRPRLMVLLELELWPGLLCALKESGCRTVIINGRITEKSLKKYLLFKNLWPLLKPEQVMAISREDANRFRTLFQSDQVGVMPNIKFDGLSPDRDSLFENRDPQLLISPEAPTVLLGSVRQQEETALLKIILKLFKEKPDVIIGLIPRHLHRVPHWKQALKKAGIPWVIRSGITFPVPNGTVILWDLFGELSTAYRHFRAAFVGGSLAPLGGQNFLEPLTCGVRPVIGPSWKNFFWVGKDIVKEGLLRIGENWLAVADILLNDLATPPDREQVRKRMSEYIDKRKGGVHMACDLIHSSITDQKSSEG